MKVKILSFFLLAMCLLIVQPYGCSSRGTKSLPEPRLDAEISSTLIKDTNRSYSELFDGAPQLHYTPEQLKQMSEYLKQSKDYCVQAYSRQGRAYEQELRRRTGALMSVGGRMEEPARHERHCDIQNLRILKARADVLADQGVPVAYENRQAKLELIEKWPAEYRLAQQSLSSGQYRNRRWANVSDIGYRTIAEDQEEDIRKGQEAIVQLRRSGLMPPEIDDPAVRNYVTSLAENLARHSDLQVPVRVTILNAREINAFALPGGFLFVQRGLLEAADNESELAGVLSHEIAHASARHGHRMLRKASMANIILQAARIAGAVAGGGDALYYALRYGAAGLGLALNLNLLGKSREFELEADQLGIQYAWHGGYDVHGFLNFFDKMAAEKGYVTGASWFRTHPPFYERMVNVRKEMLYLENKPNPIVQTAEFQKMHDRLKELPVPLERDRYGRERFVPIRTEGCPPPEETRTELNLQGVENVCLLPEGK